jgi:hypothetical protein
MAALVATIIAACGEREMRPEEPRPIPSSGAPPFHPPSYAAGRRIDSIAMVRIGAGRTPAFVVGSRNDSATGTGRFDLVEIFGYDSLARKWVRLLSDSVAGAQRIDLRDITGDGFEEVVVPLTSGGNEPVSTFGMNVYSAHGGATRRVFRSTWQDPHFDSIPGIPGSVITVRRALWPLFAPRADALVYVDDVFAYRDGRFRSVLTEARRHFSDAADRALAAYRPLRDSIARQLEVARRAMTARRDSLARAGVDPEIEAEIDTVELDSISYDHEIRLFHACALVMINEVKAGDERAARTFWSQQQAFLRSALSEEQFDELAAFSDKLMTGG